MGLGRGKNVKIGVKLIKLMEGEELTGLTGWRADKGGNPFLKGGLELVSSQFLVHSFQVSVFGCSGCYSRVMAPCFAGATRKRTAPNTAGNNFYSLLRQGYARLNYEGGECQWAKFTIQSSIQNANTEASVMLPAFSLTHQAFNFKPKAGGATHSGNCPRP